MKKVLLTAAAVFAFGFANAQETKFGVKAGVDLASAKAEFEGISATASETGFYFGGFAEINVSEKFAIEPALLYVAIKDLNQIQIPVLAKYSVAEKISILAGPNVGFILDAEEGTKSLNLAFDLGASYDISEDISIDVKYNLGLSNLIEDAPSDFSLKLSGIFIGLGYKF